MKRNGISLFGRAQFPLLYSERSLATQGAEKEVEIEVLFMKRFWNVFVLISIVLLHVHEEKRTCC